MDTDQGPQTKAARFGWRLKILAAAVALASLLAGTTAFPQQAVQIQLGQEYTITDLGVPFTLNDTDSQATAINNAGTVVGYSGDFVAEFGGYFGNQDAFVWTPDTKNGTTGAMTYLGGLAGSYCFSPEHTVGGLTTPAGYAQFDSSAQSINSSGQIVGLSWTSPDGLCTDAVIHAALWKNGTPVDLGVPPGYVWSYAGAINDGGQIVGWAQPTGESIADAFLINKGAFSILGSLSGIGSGFAIPSSINNSGTLVGTDFSFTSSGFTGSLGFVHTGLGPILSSEAIGTLGGAFSSALAINNTGRIVGDAAIGGDDAASHAFYLDPSGMRDMGTANAADPLANSQAVAINNGANDAVGWSSVAANQQWLSGQHAVIWKGSSAVIDLNTVIDPHMMAPFGTDPSTPAGACPHIQCWELISATGINDLGQIVGEGIVVPQGQTTGQHHAFLLTPICATQGGDSDGDGLCDNWEKYGYLAGDGTFVDLPAMGADPNHKDIFIQADYFTAAGGSCDGICTGHTHQPSPDALAEITAAFQNAPVDNPDGTTGITLHVDSGPDSIMNPLTGETWGSLSEAHAIAETESNFALGAPILDDCPPPPPAGSPRLECPYDFTDFNNIANANLAPSRVPIFHYVLFAHDLNTLFVESDGSNSTGAASGKTPFIPASGSIVSLGGYFNFVGTVQEQAGTLMHELGHQLGLHHGGQDDTNYKPNYLSVMNYSFQMDGLLADGGSGLLDYSRFASIPPLNEKQLNDTVGLNGGPDLDGYGTVYYCPAVTLAIELDANGPIDWACDGSSAETSVQADIAKTNYDVTILNDYEDWHHLIYDGGAVGGLGVGSPFVQPTTVAEPESMVPPIPVPYRVQIASPGVGTIPAGANVSLNFTISNSGSQPDTYSLAAVTSDSEWNTANVPSTVTLAAGTSRQISLPLAISGCTTSGFTTRLTLRAVSQAHPTIYDTAFAELNVEGSIGGIGVPSLVGLTEALAESVITDAGFVTGTVTTQGSASVPVGSVISQTPGPCALAAAGSPILLVVSSGPSETIVPNVVNLTQAAAIAAMNAAGLNLGLAPITVASSTVPAGDVVSQTPAAGSTVTPGTFFSLTIASAAPEYDLTPNFTGEPISLALPAISAAGLNLGQITGVFSLTVPAGGVLSQVPAPGSPAIPGSYVNLTVTYGNGENKFAPDIEGDTQPAAIVAILTAGLSIGSVGETSSNTAPSGTVVLQSPLPGITLPPDAPVSFSISTGPVGPESFVVPNVYGLTQPEASSAITAAGLTLGTATQAQQLSVPVGDVFSQTPQPGSYVAGGSAVNLEVSAAAAQYTVPNLTSSTSYATAYADIIAAGLTPGPFTAQPSSTVAFGNVISVSPPSGTVVAGGSGVSVTYSLGILNNTVPSVVGENQVFATNSIDPGLTFFESVTREPSTTVPDSFVISQNPTAGSQATAGSPINLVVSSGGPVAAAVPNIVGMGITANVGGLTGAAEATLNAAGFAVGSVTFQPSNSVPFGQVMSQNPSAGTVEAWDTSVSFVVSSGPPASINVPNIFGETLGIAISALTAQSLKWTLTTQSSQTVPAGTVISQNPSAGTVSQGQIPGQGNLPVTFVVSAGPNTVPTYSLLTQFGDYGGAYAGDGQFYGPQSLAIDPNTGNILAGDQTGRIQIFDRTGNFKGYFGGTGVQFITATVPGTNQLATLYPAGTGGGLFGDGYVNSTFIEGYPMGLAVDPVNGNVVALDAANRVLIFNSAGVLQSAFGSPGQGPGQFSFQPSGAGGVAIDPATENILVADWGNNRVQIFSSTGTYLGQFGTEGAGNGQFGYGPVGIAVDPGTRNIAVLDRGNARVEIFNSSGAYLSQFGAPVNAALASWVYPPCVCEGLAIDPVTHNIIVQGAIEGGPPFNSSIQILDSKGNYLSQFGGYGITYSGGLAVDPVSHHIVTFGLAGNETGTVQIFGAPIALTPTSTTLTSSLNPASSGQSVTVTANVAGGDDITGTIQFFYGGTSLAAPVALASGSASFTTSTLPMGTDSITATYSGDGNYAASSGLLNETVTGTGSNVGLAASANPVTVGHAVTFTATVSGSSPTGTVEFLSGGTSLGVPVRLSGGAAALTTSDLPVGADSITAAYSGDLNNAPNTSAALVENVTPAATSTSMLTSNAQSLAGQPVTFTALVSGDGPTGTIQFMDGGAALGAAATLSGSVAAITTSSLSAGTHLITAVYSGDASNTASTSAPLSEQILASGSSLTSVNSSMNPASIGQTVTFVANVLGSSPTGTVQFMDGLTALGGPAVLTSGAASLSTSSLTSGLHSITAAYSGDASNTPSTSAPLSQVVSRVGSYTVVTSSANPAAVGQTVTLTATVTGSSPTGTVQFGDGTSALGSPVTLVAGTAALSTSSLTAGTHSISATYSGDGANVPSTSPVLSQVVTAKTAETINFGSLPNVVYGVAPITLSASASSSLPITFALTSGPATLSGSTLTITGTGTVTVTASQAGNSTYAAATPVMQSFIVNPALLTVTATNATMTSGGAVPSFGFLITGFVNGDSVASATSGSPIETTIATPASSAGSYPITITQGTLAATNYTFTFVDGTLAVTAGAPTLVSLAVSPSSESLPVGAAQNYTATGTYSDASVKNLTSQVTWGSTNTPAATVSPSGFAFVTGTGGTTITALLSGVNGSATLMTFAPSYNVVCVPTSITTDANGNYVVEVSVSNDGNVTLSNVAFTSAKLISTAASSLPAGLGSLAPGSMAFVTFTFSPSTGAAGTRGVLQVQGSYLGAIPGAAGQPGGFNSSGRVTLP